MNPLRQRFFVQVAVLVSVLILAAVLFVALRAGHARSVIRAATLQAHAALRDSTALVSSPSPEQTGEERLLRAESVLRQGTDALARAASASLTYDSLAHSPLSIVRGLTRVLAAPIAVPASLSSAVTTLSSRVFWRREALASLRKLKGYDPASDVGALTLPSDSRELIRRLYFAKRGMEAVLGALQNPPFAPEVEAVASTRSDLNATLAIIDPLIVALDAERWGEAQALRSRFYVSADTARVSADAAYDALTSDESLAAMVSGHAQ